MYPSTEVRWFGVGTVPAEVLEWFQRVWRKEEAPFGDVGSRTDYYLRLGGDESLGIKLREGKVEVKQRHCQHGVVTLNQQVSGLEEEWHKWSYALAEPATDLGKDSPDDSFWVAVRKVRSLCKYEVTGGRRVLAVPAEGFPEEGGQVELTRLTVEESEWWTVGFEAWGKDIPMKENFHLVVKHVLADSEPPVFDAEDSYSYPKWLAQVS